MYEILGSMVATELGIYTNELYGVTYHIQWYRQEFGKVVSMCAHTCTYTILI